MPLLPITLGIKRDQPRKAGRSSRAVLNEKIRIAVLQRDKNTCQYCGFVSQKHQTVRLRDTDASSSGADAFVTACIFCDQCFSLETAGLSGSGVLIWLPEIGQAELNHICRAAYLARTSEESIAETGQITMDALLVRRYEARRRIGTDDPLILATVLSDTLSDEEYEQRMRKLDGLRLMPLDRRIMRRGEKDVNVFPSILSYWQSAEGPFAKFQPDVWSGQLNKILGTAGQA